MPGRLKCINARTSKATCGGIDDRRSRMGWAGPRGSESMSAMACPAAAELQQKQNHDNQRQRAKEDS